jgi:glyoxylase-like metal-dependent hydrolase (beta-lactamase superfamily II)
MPNRDVFPPIRSRSRVRCALAAAAARVLTPAEAPPQAGGVTALASGVRRVVAPNPGLMTGPGTNTYLIGTRELVVLDPGPALTAHTEALVAAIGTARVVAIALTHTHADHSGGLQLLRRHYPAPVLARLPRDAMHHELAGLVDHTIEDGGTIATDAGALIAVATPGHASNHLCWQQPGLRWLYTGDHILGTTSPVILPPDGDMGEYLDSLARLARLDLERLLPGHGPSLGEPQGVIAALVRHRLEREARIYAALPAAGAATLDELLPVAYADVAPSLYVWARRTLEAHLLRLGQIGRVRRDGDRWARA